MRKLKRWCAVLGLAAAASAAQAAPLLLSEGFDDVARLAASGWALVNQSPLPGTTWFQGNAGVFDAAAGAPQAYVAANFLASDSGPISNLLMSPALWLGGGERLSFETRTEAVDGFAFDDNLAVWLGRRVGDQIVFETRLAGLGPSVSGRTLPSEWQQVDAYVPRQPTSRELFIGFFYTSGDAANANYVGLDSVTVSVPEPNTALLLALGVAGVAVTRRLRRAGGSAALALAVALSCGALPVLAADAPAGLVVRDPVTGVLRAPTPEEFQALQAQQQKKDGTPAAAKDADGATARQRAVPQAAPSGVELRTNGSRKVVLGEHGMSYSVISRKADGTLGAVQCVSGAEAAEAAVKGPRFGASVLTREPANESR